MKFLVRISFMGMVFALAEINAQTVSIDDGSKLSCIQGVWKKSNSFNEELQEYNVFKSYKSVSISYGKNEELFRITFLVNGFYDTKSLIDRYSRFEISKLRPNGACFVWFFEDDVDSDGFAVIGGVQTDFICDDYFIEMSDNSMTILEKESFLPYRAYAYLVKQGVLDNKDYITEYGIQNELKTGIVAVQKAYFRSEPRKNTEKKSYVLQGDPIIVDEILEDWVKVAYVAKPKTTIGWLKKSEVKLID